MPTNELTHFYQDLLLGGTAGAIVKTTMAPIERVKILFQTMKSNPKVLSGEIQPYKNIPDCCRRVYREQGLRAFWDGNLVNCLRYAPQQGSALAFNGLLRAYTPRYDPKSDYWKDLATKLLAGGTAGAAANFVCYPFDFARTRLASDLGETKTFNGMFDCLSKTLKQGGLRGLYRGSAVTIAGSFVYRGGQLGLFQQIMDANPYKKDKGMVVGVCATFLAATLARTITTPFNYPFDTVRRRMMLDSELKASERLYRSGMHCFSQVWKAEGLKGMYKGVGPELVRGLGGPLVLTAYNRVQFWTRGW
eukprot:TRINITY_DN68199_c5_g7_i1.p1 TRINITY_DN68199_c5_g7~~TRINITY_DN68199_c5_g7_i1.p1  ORF type:complete len:305 (+),score=24.14 TRINITY_DN68199_c5_g7_i1:81-995(+)